MSRDAAGYFAISLNVYGREGEPCYQCGHRLKGLRDRPTGHRLLPELPTMTRNGSARWC